MLYRELLLAAALTLAVVPLEGAFIPPVHTPDVTASINSLDSSVQRNSSANVTYVFSRFFPLAHFCDDTKMYSGDENMWL